MDPKRDKKDLNKDILGCFEVPNIIKKDQVMVSFKKDLIDWSLTFKRSLISCFDVDMAFSQPNLAFELTN